MKNDNLNIIITGATNGVGKSIAQELSQRKGITLGIIGRSPKKLEALKNELQSNNNKILTYIADLSLLKMTQDAIEKVKLDFTSIDIIFNNAGAVFMKKIITNEGFERTLVTNYLTMFLLNSRLLPLVKNAAKIKGRASIINTTSSGHKIEPIWDDISLKNKPFSIKNMEAYQQSKHMVILHSFDFAKQLAKDNIFVNCVHPGWVASSGLMDGINFPFPINFFIKVLNPFMNITPEKSAERFIWLAFDKSAKSITGEYITDNKIDKAWKPTHNEKNQLRLRKMSESIIAKI